MSLVAGVRETAIVAAVAVLAVLGAGLWAGRDLDSWEYWLPIVVVVPGGIAAVLGTLVRRRLRRSARDLHAAESRLEAILHNLDEAVMVNDANGRFVYANPAAARLVRMDSAEAMVSQPPGAVMELFEVTLEDGTPVDLDDLPSRRILHGLPAQPTLVLNRVLATGEERWLLQRATAVLDDDGELALVVSVVEDVTQAKRAERAQRLLADAATLLAAAERAEAMIEGIEGIVVPRLADGCAITLGEAGGATASAPAEPGRLLVVPVTAGARRLGTMRLTAETPRAFDGDGAVLAEELGRRLGAALHAARLTAERAEIAHTLQAGLLPAALPRVPRWQAASLYRPVGEANEVGGDFYDAFPTPGGWTIVVGDVAGKGPRAASLTGMTRHTLRTATRLTGRLVHAYAELNQALLGEPSLSLCTVGGVRLADAWARIVSAGHPLPVLVRGGVATPVGRTGPLLGAYPESSWPEISVDLEAGDVLVLYTDGVLDAVGDAGERFGEERLLAALTVAEPGAAGAVRAVGEALDAFAATGQRDDTAVIAVAWEGVLEIREELPATQIAPAAARRAVRGCIDGAVPRELLDRALVLTSELVTNAVRHGGGAGPVDLRARVGTTALRVEVRDSGNGFVPGPVTPGPEGGWGLALVEQAADRWGVEPGTGTAVWFEMDLVDAPGAGG